MIKDSDDKKGNSLQILTKIKDDGPEKSILKEDYHLICQNTNLELMLPRKNVAVLKLKYLQIASCNTLFNF